jgi:signal transduction histidine kinase
MLFLVSINVFYVQFLSNYLDLGIGKPALYFVVKYFVWFNVVLFIIFLLMAIAGVEGESIFAVASMLTMPVSLTIMIMTWYIRSVYARVAAVGMMFATIGETICHLLIFTKTDTYLLYNGNAYAPAQVGVLIDIFVLGYGLSLRAAESDKKLVQTLLENREIVETERSRLAKDLHDGLGGLLSGIKLTLISVKDNVPEKSAGMFNKAGIQLDKAIREMRRIAHHMMPEALLKFGLSEAIQDFCDSINESNLVKIKYTQIGSLQKLLQSAELIIYRIIQELADNALKHASAKNIFIQIIKHPRGITITVEDDGNGFDHEPLLNTGGAGLKQVQSGVDYLKGYCDIKTEKGYGTAVNIEIPV